jgi:Predicted DNA-binding proteins
MVSGFKPYGYKDKVQNPDAVFLLCEEYETLRLADYEKHNHCEAALIMQVSRPTFTRMYISAREKIATAFIEGRPVIIEDTEIEVENISLEEETYIIKPCGQGICPKGRRRMQNPMIVANKKNCNMNSIKKQKNESSDTDKR